ncbi:MAG: ATP-binding cassette domain-containing protein [Pseudomonadota bacterium]
MLRVQDLKYRRGDDVLLENLQFVVHPGQRVAVAGRNGAGKSTLFQLILGQLHAEQGELSVPKGWRIAHMRQETEVTQRAALDFVIDGHTQLRRVQQRIEAEPDATTLADLHTQLHDLGGYEAEANAAEIMHGLGFSPTDTQKPYADFSGGWRIRLNLAQALMSPCDLLLLDEPTNHLDLEAIMWLESWLARFPGTVLLIAHDRAFLDACTDHTLYLSAKTGRLYQGNYSSCERQRAEHVAQEAASASKREAKAGHIQKFVDRFRAKASKAKQVQSRIKALEKLQTSAVLHFESPYKVNFRNPDKVSNPLLSMRDVELGYASVTVLSQIAQTILPGARIGVLGENGAGKSTLLKAMVGALPPQRGTLQPGSHCDIGYFAQHQLETLDVNKTALLTITHHKPNWKEQQCRDYLGGWGFSDQMITRPVKTLSGGEKARLVLALLAADQPAVLVLDEPTNHLDLDMRDALAMALQEYRGAVVIVSHDRALLATTIDEFWLVANGKVQRYPGDLDDYTQLKHGSGGPGHSVHDDAEGSAESRKQLRQARARKREANQALQKQVKQLERKLEQQTDALAEIEKQLADTDTYQSLAADDLQDLLTKAGQYRHRVEQLEEDWMEASTRLETALADEA